MSGHYVLGKDARTPVPAEFMEWAKAPRHEEGHSRPGDGWARVGHEEIGEIRISTVFLGLDHSFGGGPPVLFESMVFGFPEGHELADHQARYHTWDEAAAGHLKLVAKVRAKIVEGIKVTKIFAKAEGR